MNNKIFHIIGIIFIAIFSYFLGKDLFLDALISVEGNSYAIFTLWLMVVLFYLTVLSTIVIILFRKEEELEFKILYCKSCERQTKHIKTGFRKTFESQRYRCLTCGEER